MATQNHLRMLSQVTRAALPLSFYDDAEYDPLLAAIGDSRVVLIGEASHGTHDFYRERARITRRLIAEKGFCAVAAEADWPDAYRVNRYVLDLPRGPDESRDENSVDALRGFERFPAWMWRNMDVVAFAEWLREHNHSGHNCAGFYGLDLYSLFASAQAVLAYFDQTDAAAAARARYRYSCFEDFEEDTQAYGYAARFGMTESCESAVLEQLTELRRKTIERASASWDGPNARGEAFSAEQNALLVRNAERYYRAMFERGESSWNLRDTHMSETLDRLLEFLGSGAKAVVWAHNSHLGDARATQMGQRGELNVGQLARERYGAQCFNIGFSTCNGEVTAADNWDEPAQRKRVRTALDESYEWLFHESGLGDFLLLLRDDTKLREALDGPLLERAIGVIYRPESERLSHYFHASLPQQFDAVIHIDRTRALVPLETTAPWQQGEVPETYPSTL